MEEPALSAPDARYTKNDLSVFDEHIADYPAPEGAMTDAVSTFQKRLRGPLVQPADPQYDEVRALYNGMIDKRPRLIARCADAADVIAAAHFGRQQGLLIAIRGGGHNGPGLGSVDDGLVIDLSLMKSVRVDPANRTVRVGPGCTSGDVDHATHAFGLAVPFGIVSTTGVAGLTLAAPSALSLMHLYPIDGAVRRVARHATAWSARDATFSMVIAAIDSDAAKADALKAWGRSYWKAVRPYNLEGAYVNFMMDDEATDRIQATYGDNFARLAVVKATYDVLALGGNAFQAGILSALLQALARQGLAGFVLLFGGAALCRLASWWLLSRLDDRPWVEPPEARVTFTAFLAQARTDGRPARRAGPRVLLRGARSGSGRSRCRERDLLSRRELPPFDARRSGGGVREWSSWPGGVWT